MQPTPKSTDLYSPSYTPENGVAGDTLHGARPEIPRYNYNRADGRNLEAMSFGTAPRTDNAHSVSQARTKVHDALEDIGVIEVISGPDAIVYVRQAAGLIGSFRDFAAGGSQ